MSILSQPFTAQQAWVKQKLAVLNTAWSKFEKQEERLTKLEEAVSFFFSIVL